MIRSFKIFGLALAAVFAMSAMMASGASAKTALVTGGPNVLGHDNPLGNTVFTGASNVKCEKATYPGTAVESTITLNPEFDKCKGGASPATVTPNGCQYSLTLGTLIGHQAGATVSLVCSGPVKQVEVDLFTDEAHTERFCIVEIPAQANLPNNLIVTDEANGHLRVTGTVEGIANFLAPGGHSKGNDCVPATTQVPNAELHVDVTVTPTGKNKLKLTS